MAKSQTEEAYALLREIAGDPGVVSVTGGYDDGRGYIELTYGGHAKRLPEEIFGVIYLAPSEERMAALAAGGVVAHAMEPTPQRPPCVRLYWDENPQLFGDLAKQ